MRPVDIVKNIDKLPPAFKDELLLRLADREYDFSDALSEVITRNFNKLAQPVRNDLLLKLADNKQCIKSIAQIITGNYDRMPEQIRNDLLLKISDDKDAFGAIAWAIVSDYDRLPDRIRDMLFRLADDKNLSWTLAEKIVVNYTKLPGKLKVLIFKLAEHDYAAASLAGTMIRSYEAIPEDIRDELLLKVAQSKYATVELENVIDKNSSLMSENLKNQLMKKITQTTTMVLESHVNQNVGFMTESEIEKFIGNNIDQKWIRDYGHHSSTFGRLEKISKSNIDLQTLTDYWVRWYLTGEHQNSMFKFWEGDTIVYFCPPLPLENNNFRSIVMTEQAPFLIPIYIKIASMEQYPSISTTDKLLELIRNHTRRIGRGTIETSFDGEPIYGTSVIRNSLLEIDSVSPNNILGIPKGRLYQGSKMGICHGGLWLFIRESMFESGDHLLSIIMNSTVYKVEAKIKISVLV